MTESTKQVMVAVDFTECGDDALLMGLTMLQEGQVGTLHLVYVLDPRDVINDPEKPGLATEEEVIAKAPRLLVARAEALADVRNMAIDTKRLRAHARIGKPVPALIQVCVDYDADFLLVGTHGRRGIERLLLGSVAEALVREAPCPVLVARVKDYEGRTKTALPDQPYAPGEGPAQGSEVPFERTVSTTSDSWNPSGGGPTGMRIV